MLSLSMLLLAQAPLVEPVVDPLSLAKTLYESVVGGQWWMAASIALVLVVWGVRVFGTKLLPGLEPFLKNPLVSFLLPVVTASAMAAVVAFASGMNLQAALLAALKVAAGAVFAYVGMKKVQEAREIGAAAGAEAAKPSTPTKINR